MTAILKELRDLDAQLARGDITDAAYMAQRAALIDSVDVVEPEFVTTGAAVSEPVPQKSGATLWGLGLIICLAVLGTCLCLAMLTFADFNLALTLGVTVLAALTVALFRNLEE
ncbi:SHOCT domain-containing protein [uncultured Roseobacter sp.]|uniref:SHOCT domain-containing protein n=1 Tax=uncultured Roseobacter sp. TaxID=114847 RepID=UPI00260FE6FD|nr:SHOCT domain-containing protein [uncultured Roseobacter sp.]